MSFFGGMGQSAIKNLGNGGTMDGDVTVTGDLTVNGGIALTLSEVLQGTSTIDVNSTEALLVRKNGDGGDIFIVDTTNSEVDVFGTLNIDQNSNASSLVIDTEATSAHGIYFNSPAITTGNVILVDGANSLTTGRLAYFGSNSSDTSTRNLFEIQNINASATGATALKITQNSTGLGVHSTGTILIDQSAGTSNSAVLRLEADRGSADQDSGEIRFYNQGGSDHDYARIVGVRGGADNSGYLQFRTSEAGTEGTRMTISSTGIGIGTDSPSTPIHIKQDNSTTDTTNGLLIENDGTGDAVAQFLLTGTKRVMMGIDNSDSDKFKIVQGVSDLGTADATVIAFDASKNIAIGHANPDATLHISSAGAKEIRVQSSDSASRLRLEGATQADIVLKDTAGGSNTKTMQQVIMDDVFKFRTLTDAGSIGVDPVLQMNLATGNIGIGTASPSSRLHLYQQGDATNNELTLEVDSASGGNTGNQYITMIREDTNRGNEIRFLTHPHGGSATHKFSLGQTDSDEAGVDGTEFYIGRSSLGANPDFVISSAGDTTLAGTLTVTGGTIKSGSTIGIDGNGIGTGNIYLNGGVIVNENSNDVDFRIESNDNANMFFVDGGNNTIGIGTATPSSYDVGGNNLVIYENGNAGLTIATGTGHAGNIHFADGTSGNEAYRGIIQYNHAEDALKLATSGNNRLVLDDNSRISLSNNDGGANNTTFGNLAGAALTTNGNRNSLFGHLAGNDISSGQENTLMGYTAGEKIATGLYNTAIGSQSFVTNVDGDFNTAIGYGALYSFEASNNAEGSNTIVGANASFHLDSGQYNTMVGTSAGESSAGTITYQMNVGVGYKALFDLTTGDGNVAIGSESASNLTIGNYNISIGKNTLITEGVGNGTTAVGNGAGGYQNSDSNNEATGNSLFGYVAGEFNVTGTNNTYIGYESGKGALNQSNSANTGLGYGSLKSITTGNSNTAIGAYAMQIATTATVNTAIGGEAMSGITTGAVQDAVAVGYGAFKGHTSTSTGTNGTVAIGRATLFSLTTGDKNTAIGYKAMTSQTTGARNTVIGYEAMFTADGGEDYNTIIGSQAGYYINNDASHDNVIIGKNALQGGTGTILGNVAIGSGAMDAVSNNNQTGVVAIGNDALGALTSGASNTAIGYQSGLYLTTGGSNTYVGYEAGKGVDGTPQTGGNNVAIGQGSGVLLQGSATSNTFVGTAAGDVVTTGTNNVIIGTLADPNTATGTNQTVIGYNAVGQGDNTVTLGDSNVTHVCLGH